jgi:hypothetical protein
MALSVVAVSLHVWRSSPKRKARPPSVTDRWAGPSPFPAAMGHLSVVDRSVVTPGQPLPPQ